MKILKHPLVLGFLIMNISISAQANTSTCINGKDSITGKVCTSTSTNDINNNTTHTNVTNPNTTNTDTLNTPTTNTNGTYPNSTTSDTLNNGSQNNTSNIR